MILILVPLVGIVIGVVAWFGLRGFGAMDVLGSAPAPSRPSWRESRADYPRDYSRGIGGVRERIDDLPRGCFYAVIGVSAIWILGWLILLIVGLALLA